eukprot:TRINITY_DN11237_c0_g1_i3.p3 TRINITY_DN11237_c0_g1~~TRINITY_DN11237_c0_g1_i3.p3  ORF type:complete len:109 (-),score=4.72 TRINITY_DN11237_c0_g1_i3:309-635(-)
MPVTGITGGIVNELSVAPCGVKKVKAHGIESEFGEALGNSVSDFVTRHTGGGSEIDAEESEAFLSKEEMTVMAGDKTLFAGRVWNGISEVDKPGRNIVPRRGKGYEFA